ncbi:MAG TPA: arginine--tRNA ligase, partial [Geobacterales bacterium]|nr:arginine--tRNA ligase [Geobacterales bacterium]
MTFSYFKKEVEEILHLYFKDERELFLEIPPSEDFGELSSTICFKVANKYGKKPNELAIEVKKQLDQAIGRFNFIKKIEALNGYLNFYMDVDKISKLTLDEISEKRQEYGKSDIGKGKKVLIEHTNANPNKALHIGHARNTCLGDSLARLLKFTNHKVIVLDYADDTGSQMADLVLGFTKLGLPMESQVRFDKYCGDQ